ncbi:MAG: type II secretion system minor pseudopilin GspK [Candidatus Hydrogenedentes bacterium]|nr:type II secretion system minor pseudopilin GspK [Candidatus Hydrogenedentota bacterium]
MSRYKTDIKIKRKDAGVALILALIFVALLSAIVFAFMYEMEVDASFAQNQGADFQAQLAARSAAVDGMMILAEQYADMLESGMPPIDSELDGSQWAMGASFQTLNEATMRTSIVDEYGKLNLNAILKYNNGSQERNDALIDALRQFFALRSTDSYDPVDAIIDWLDYDDMDAQEPDGAENDYYTSLENPYPCKNGPMDSIEELLLIKGLTSELYFGNAEEEQKPLSEYMTVHGDWAGRVNVNTAREEVIAAVIGGKTGNTDITVAQQIYDEARMAPFEDVSRLSQYVQLPPEAMPSRRNRRNRNPMEEEQQNPQARRRRQRGEAMSSMFRVNSNAFRIYGDGMMDEVLVRCEVYVFRHPYDEREVEEEMSRLGTSAEQDFYDISRQMFRILDWKIMQ